MAYTFKHGDRPVEGYTIQRAVGRGGFGEAGAGEITLIDEVLTPDSSRFWPKTGYKVGISPPSFDKQFVRDWLESVKWDKKPPAPALPEDVVRKTSEKYVEAYRLLVGRELPK